ncbi:50S ribosomal protein L18 [Anaerocaecibacter muris]|uniref:50S ribosomal protein L18 n=1 Tax=Anaerocaecibacter muris TaxID=2941513 RepID=UPI002040B0D0|nr:50S ribosomal protein L18 [Anaerocaecibacter muris]
MIKKIDKNKVRAKRHARLRHDLKGTAARPRLAVYRSTSHIYAQVIDDVKGVTLCSSSTLVKGANLDGKTKTQQAEFVGGDVAAKAKKNGITEVVFDRGGYLYTGRVKALADAARAAGLKF